MKTVSIYSKLTIPKQGNMRPIQFTMIVLSGLLVSTISSSAQDKPLTQNIRGIVTDRLSGSPLPYVSVGLLNIAGIEAITDESGEFILKDVPIGRYTIRATTVGYEPGLLYEILVISAREVYVEIPLKQRIHPLDEVIIRPQTNKNQPLNEMALAGARMLSVEEASRYAGGMDDPARLVSAFAGVASGTFTNGISIHGNAPHLLLWRLEDIEIPNPNHFADLSTLGGGVLSSLSHHVLSNSDFFTGAFPAEYSNAVSGIFDMKLRNGNNQNYEHTFQAGVLGIDFASEGPTNKEHRSSYIFNYRYSTTGLLGKVMDFGQTLDYQDLNFKMNFPTGKAGTFTVWTTALIDKFESEIEDPTEWEYADDNKQSRAKQYMAAGGVGHRYFFNSHTQLKTTLATTYFNHTGGEDIFDEQMEYTPWLDLDRRNTNIVLTTSLNRKFSARFTHKTGFTFTHMLYDMNLNLAPYVGEALENISKGKGSTNLLSVYTSSSIGLSDNVTFTIGLNTQMLTLNNHWTLEPRTGLKWLASQKSSFALSYGLHSRMEKMDVFFVKTRETDGQSINEHLDFTKAHHVILSYHHKIADDMNLKAEPYFQYLYDIPVIADSSYSVLNRNEFYVTSALVNEGKGRNVGVDITLEKYLSKGFYHMVTASLFDSRYRGGDGVWRGTRFNRNFIINALIGKEWTWGSNRQHMLGVNLRFTLQGGDRYSPVDEEATLNHPDKEVQYDQSNAYSARFSPVFLAHTTISYKINKKTVAHEFAIKAINVTGYQEYFGHLYNLTTQKIEPYRYATALPNISYKLNF